LVKERPSRLDRVGRKSLERSGRERRRSSRGRGERRSREEANKSESPSPGKQNLDSSKSSSSSRSGSSSSSSSSDSSASGSPPSPPRPAEQETAERERNREPERERSRDHERERIREPVRERHRDPERKRNQVPERERHTTERDRKREPQRERNRHSERERHKRRDRYEYGRQPSRSPDKREHPSEPRKKKQGHYEDEARPSRSSDRRELPPKSRKKDVHETRPREEDKRRTNRDLNKDEKSHRSSARKPRTSTPPPLSILSQLKDYKLPEPSKIPPLEVDNPGSGQRDSVRKSKELDRQVASVEAAAAEVSKKQASSGGQKRGPPPSSTSTKDADVAADNGEIGIHPEPKATTPRPTLEKPCPEKKVLREEEGDKRKARTPKATAKNISISPHEEAKEKRRTNEHRSSRRGDERIRASTRRREPDNREDVSRKRRRQASGRTERRKRTRSLSRRSMRKRKRSRSREMLRRRRTERSRRTEKRRQSITPPPVPRRPEAREAERVRAVESQSRSSRSKHQITTSRKEPEKEIKSTAEPVQINSTWGEREHSSRKKEIKHNAEDLERWDRGLEVPSPGKRQVRPPARRNGMRGDYQPRRLQAQNEVNVLTQNRTKVIKLSMRRTRTVSLGDNSIETGGDDIDLSKIKITIKNRTRSVKLL